MLPEDNDSTLVGTGVHALQAAIALKVTRLLDIIIKTIKSSKRRRMKSKANFEEEEVNDGRSKMRKMQTCVRYQ